MKPCAFPSRHTSRQMQVLSYLIRNGAASRKQIADDLSVTGATLTNISNELIQKGIIYENGIRESGNVGRKQIVIDVHANYRYALGMDVANRYLRVTLLNIKLELVAMREWKYPMLTLDVLDEAIGFIQRLIAEYGEDKILGLGLLGQGYIYENEFLSLPFHDIRERIQARISMDIYSTMNNIRGIAIAQTFLCEEDQNFFMLHYGPGVCSVLVKDGVVSPGAHNKAGEIGHVIWNTEDGVRCDVCGKVGCLESQINFDRVARRALPSHQAAYTDYEELSKACRNDGGKALDEALTELSKVVNLLVGFSDPQKVLLCGQIFTDPLIHGRFCSLLCRLDGSLREENICLVQNYSEKRWKSAGIVVLNEYFGNNATKSFL